MTRVWFRHGIPMAIVDQDLRIRVNRLIHSEHRTEDLDRIFLGVRERTYGRSAVRDIGDFVAHRGQRDSGLSTRVVRDIATSARIWISGLSNPRQLTLNDALTAATANVKLATDPQIKAGTGLARSKAEATLKRAIAKVQEGRQISDEEAVVLEYLGNRFVWNPAITDESLCADLRFVLLKNDLLDAAESVSFEASKTFLALYVIALLHGSAAVLQDGTKADLRLGVIDRGEHLAIKAQIPIEGLGKPTTVSVCVFSTELAPSTHCEAPCLQPGWDGPLELTTGGLLSAPQCSARSPEEDRR